jgi:hypothetical protein
MRDSHHHAPQTEPLTDPIERLVDHLLRYPADLVDSYRLLRRFRVSSKDFQRALTLVEQRSAQPPETDS